MALRTDLWLEVVLDGGVQLEGNPVRVGDKLVLPPLQVHQHFENSFSWISVPAKIPKRGKLVCR